jgi:type II secretory pathway component PulM
MGMLFTVLSIALVVAVLVVVAYVLFVEPFVDHAERFRDSRGRRLGSSPRLD